MTTKTANLELVEVEDQDVGPGAAAGFNASYDRLDALVQLSVKSATTTVPPSAPSQGDRYIVPVTVGAGNAWSAFARRVAYFSAAGWIFMSPKPGWRTNVEDTGSSLLYASNAWVTTGAGGALVDLSDVSIAGATAGQILTLDTDGLWKARGGGGSSNVTADSHPATADPIDDEFESGSSIDTTGARFSGASPWAWINQSTSSTLIRRGALAAFMHGGTNEYNAVVQPVSGAFTVEAKMRTAAIAANIDTRAALYVGLGGSGKAYIFGWYYNTGSPPQYYINAYTNPTTFSANAFLASAAPLPVTNGTPYFYLLAGYDPSTGVMTFRVSLDGIWYQQLTTINTSVFLGSAPVAVGLGSDGQGGINYPSVYDWFRRTA